MSPKPYINELDPDTRTTLKMYLFRNVRNVEVIRSNIVKGEWRCAAVKPALVAAPLQVAAAANAAAVARLRGALLTNTVYAEILYNLSLSKNISQSLTKFGVEKGQELLLCFLVSDEDDESEKVVPQIEGELCDISALGELTDLKSVKTVYKLNNLNLKSDTDLLDVIVSRMATRNFVTH